MVTIQQKKVAVSTTSLTTVQGSITLFPLRTNQKFKRIKHIAAVFGAQMPPRRGSCFVGHLSRQLGREVSLWCPSIDPNGMWGNKWGSTSDTIIESKDPKETRDAFVNRVTKKDVKHYNPDGLRLTFVKINGMYSFTGIYRVSKVDYDNCCVTMQRIANPAALQVVSVTQKTVTITVTEEEFTQISF